MEELDVVYATGTVVVLYLLAHVVARKFDPFAPVWLFLVGYVHVYIIQALSYHDWAVGVRGKELVAAANFRAFWALLWFLFVYHLGIGRRMAAALPRPPRGWSPMLVGVISPPLIVWGLFCSGRRRSRGSANRLLDDLGSGNAVSLVPVRDDGGGGVAHRDGPDNQFGSAALLAGGARGRGSLRR